MSADFSLLRSRGRMLRFLLAASSVCWGLTYSASVAYAADSSTIAVFLDFESASSSATISEMESEITAIMKPSGLHFEWHMLRDRTSGDSFPDLVVLTFKGVCEEEEPLMNELGPVGRGAPLAFTHISEGRILPFSEVQCDTIRKYIAPNVGSSKLRERDAILGRALGRVVAHELYHIFASSTAHAAEGVQRSFHTPKELTARQFHFTAHESEVLRATKARTQRPDVPSVETSDR
jgi:hypothetical protein